MKFDKYLKEEIDTEKMAKKLGKRIFGGCVDAVDIDTDFISLILNKDCNSIEADQLRRLLKEVDIDSIQVEKGKFVINFYLK